MAIRFLNAAKIQSNNATVAELNNAAQINFNQYQIIQVFHHTVDVIENGRFDGNKIQIAISNVKNGIFDHLFYWDFRAYSNMSSQQVLSEVVVSSIVENKRSIA